MKNNRLPILGTAIATALLPIAAAAQNVSQLQAENARLRQQVQSLQAQCGTPSAGQAAVSRAGAIEARIASIRSGQATGSVNGTVAITISMTLTNTGSVPMPLNYESRSFNVTDSNGYSYQLRNEHLATYGKDDVKGIPIATSSSASTNHVLAPGQSNTVTFIAKRYMRNGQTVGGTFDINASFGEYQNQGQGKIHKLNSYAVAFVGVPGSDSGSLPAGTARGITTETGARALEGAASKLLDRVLN